MNRENFLLHPFIKVFVFLLLATGIFLTRNILLLSIGYLIILFLMFFSKQILLHLRMILIANIPFLLLLLLVYGVILKNHSLQNGLSGLDYSMILFLRVTILTSLFQYMLNVQSDELLFFFKKIKIQGSLLIILISSFSLWKNFISKADHIITARLARGYLKNRSFITRIKQLPHVIKPLLATTLTLALERAASWKQKGFLKEIDLIQIDSLTKKDYSKFFNFVVSAIVVGWFSFVIINLAG